MNRITPLVSMTFFVIFNLIFSSGFAQLTTKSVSIFKNGTGFFYRSGKISPKEGHYHLEAKDIPKASFGTFWFAADQSIKGVSSFMDEVSYPQQLTNLAGLLSNNIGKKVQLFTEKENFSGKLQSVLGSQIVVEGTERWYTLAIKDIERWEFLEKPNLTHSTKKNEHRMRFDFDKEVQSATLDMMYLREGIGWVPHYLIDLLGTDTAQITLKAEVMNDFENLNDTEVNFVVGVPNFLYSSIQSPITSLSDSENFFRTVDALSNYSQHQNAQLNNRADFTNQVVVSAYGGNSLGGVATTAAPIEGLDGNEQEDLYFYTLPSVTLPKGGSGHYNILSLKVPVKHLYEARIPGNQANASFYYSLPSSPQISEVLHTLKITNTGNQPWTTGTAMVTQSRENIPRPVSQDLLTYTPAGEHVNLKITTAPDITVKYSEEEISREESAKRLRKVTYDLVTIEGEIEVKNHKSREIEVHTRRLIRGILSQSKPNWLLDVRRGITKYELNGQTEVCWEIPLKAGEEKTVTYKYQVYIPR